MTVENPKSERGLTLGYRLQKLSIAFLVILCLGSWHIPKTSQMQLFLLKKFEKASRYDIVLTGDSRVCQGIDPSAIESAIPGVKCFNFGFPSLGFNSDYFHHVDGHILEGSRRKLIVLGVDSSALTSLSGESGIFSKVGEMTPVERIQVALFGPFWEAPEHPLETRGLYENGWAPVTRVSPIRDLALAAYSKHFHTSRCSETILYCLCQQVRVWRKRGFRVLALRMPTSLAMFELEQSLTEYKPLHVQKELVSAGATWLDLPNSDTATYDGSHMAIDSARRVSQSIASACAKLERDP